MPKVSPGVKLHIVLEDFSTLASPVSSDGLQVDYWDVGRAATIERRAFDRRSIVDLCPVALGYGPGGAFEAGRCARQLVVLGDRVLSVVDVRGPPTLTAAEWPLAFSGDREVVESASPLGERAVSPVTARALPPLTSATSSWEVRGWQLGATKKQRRQRESLRRVYG